MRSKFISVFAFATAAALSLAAHSAFAATVGVSGVSGVWTTTDPVNPPGLSGLNTNSVSWGVPLDSKKSGYSFVGEAAGTIETEKVFNLGTFTHNNFVIQKGTSIESAGLGLVVNLVIGGMARAVNASFNFVHLETDNAGEGGGICADGGKNKSGVNSKGCADRVTIVDNTSSDQTFEIDGIRYILEITGFIRNGVAFSEFWTQEKLANSAKLLARFRIVDPGNGGGGGEPVPSPVPLPAAGWMMLAGIAALAAARARRKS